MFVQLRKMTVKEGHADKVIERFSAEGIIEKQEGLIDVTVLEKNVRRGDEEVVVMIRWQSEDHWKQWEKSDAHIAGHKANKGKPKPDYMISTEVSMYHVRAVKQGTHQ
ncbi:antibiotic biosynthesis monooxygenase [Bacillus halotolerans]|uniref:Antibiotic biosynthesis monooxygenase n=1 Tax=Bacillus halotolerans TaxID=260554 RepID=A0A9Q6F1R8_9BACI|nr:MULTISPECIES: heme-degrading oxygenase HmoA [Bacillus]MBV7321048.1 heme-degrading oxygenase HmoA [Halalkalibacterium halodurans]QQF62161.1 heme-degrading oxygenase HmoA [Bacillus mojavensis]BDG79017.1 heme-degrading monooxygenase HmoA [Bacillus subtilis]AZV48659.1 antibiotic biosynthesis monooxygenase [Bacillus halotolerans]KUP28837.1 monooxygenase [Bacillus halotolerans]